MGYKHFSSKERHLCEGCRCREDCPVAEDCEEPFRAIGNDVIDWFGESTAPLLTGMVIECESYRKE